MTLIKFHTPHENNCTELKLEDLLLYNREATFFMRMEGDELRGRGIGRGDILVVDRSMVVDLGMVGVVVKEGEMVVEELNGEEVEVWGGVKYVVKGFGEVGHG